MMKKKANVCVEKSVLHDRAAWHVNEKLAISTIQIYKYYGENYGILFNLKPESFPNSNCIPNSFPALTLKSWNEKQADE